MENRILERNVEFSDFIKVFLKKFWILVIVGAVGIAVSITMALVTSDAVSKKYEAVSIIRIPQDSSSVIITDLNTVVEITNVKRDVYDKIKPKTAKGKAVSYSDFASCINVENPKSTKMLKFTVQWDNKDTAKKIASALCAETIDNAKLMFNENELDKLKISDETAYPTGVSKINFGTVKKAVFFGVVLAGMVYVAFVVLHFIDSKVRAGDNLEKSLEIPVIGSVPCVDAEDESKNNYYSKILSEKINSQKASEEKN